MEFRLCRWMIRTSVQYLHHGFVKSACLFQYMVSKHTAIPVSRNVKNIFLVGRRERRIYAFMSLLIMSLCVSKAHSDCCVADFLDDQCSRKCPSTSFCTYDGRRVASLQASEVRITVILVTNFFSWLNIYPWTYLSYCGLCCLCYLCGCRGLCVEASHP
jgi:hypothetical protein